MSCGTTAKTSRELTISQPGGRPCFSDKYQLGHKIGEGAFGRVYATKTGRQTCSESKQALELLATKVQDIGVSCKHQEQLQNETEIWRRIDAHKNCVHLIDCFFDGRFCHLVMEMCECSLKDFLSKTPLDDDVQASQMSLDMLTGIAHLHSLSIVHCDIKPDNYLVGTDRVTVKLCDFGLSKVLSPPEKLCGQVGTVECMSPEMLLPGSSFDLTTDIWSLGVSLYVLFYGAWPYAPFAAPSRVIKAAIRSNDPAPIYPRTVDCVSSAAIPNKQMEDFVRTLLIHKASNRPSAMQALQCPFVGRSMSASQYSEGSCKVELGSSSSSSSEVIPSCYSRGTFSISSGVPTTAGSSTAPSCCSNTECAQLTELSQGRAGKPFLLQSCLLPRTGHF